MDSLCLCNGSVQVGGPRRSIGGISVDFVEMFLMERIETTRSKKSLRLQFYIPKDSYTG